MSRELLKRALDFMEVVGCSNDDICQLCDEIQEELAKPEPEPVAFMHISKTGSKENVWFNNPGLCEDEIALGDKIIPLYTNQSTPQHQTHSEQS